MNEKILVVDDEIDICKLVSRILKIEGCRLKTTLSGREALNLLKKEQFDLVVLDIKLKDISGIKIFNYINENFKDLPVILITAFPEIKTAVSLIKKGASEYFEKPFDINKFKNAVRYNLDIRRLKIETESLQKLMQKYQNQTIICKSKKMTDINKLVEKISKREISPILIEGETGVGKEVIARRIHSLSNRAKKPFVEINCAALPETLIENELFGHEKGAYTDAKSMKRGLLEIADDGFIFLDEIGELSLSTQSKLLRVLESCTFYRVGGVREISTNILIIAATNASLENSVKKKIFRADLFFRLKLIDIKMPSLRERKEDIIVLAEHFIKEFNNKYRKNVTRISKEAQDILLSYNWPGNIRELKNVIERIVLLIERDTILAHDLPLETFDFWQREKTVNNSTRIKDVEKEHIKNILNQVGGNRGKAAGLLGISRKTLWEKIKRYNISGISLKS